MVDIAATLALAGQAIELVRHLREIDKNFDSAEYKARMAELYSSLADVKMALTDAQDELRAKDRRIDELLANFDQHRDLVERNGFKYEKFEDGGPKGVAFCPRCEVNQGRYYRLARTGGRRGDFKCPECKTDFAHVSEFLWAKI